MIRTGKTLWVASLVAAGLLVAGTASAETDAELQAQRVAAAQALQAARDVGADQWTHTDLRLADESFILQNYRLAKTRADEAREKTLALKRLAGMTSTTSSSTTVIDRSSEMMAMMSKYDARLAQLEATANNALAAAQRAEAAANRAEANSLTAMEQARQALLMAKAASDRPVPASCCGDSGLKSELKSGLKDVYFDTDSSALRPDSGDALKANAQWLRDNPAVAVTIAGYADERGTQGYNQALGQRRAQAARDALVAAGVAAERITLVSYGEDRPAVAGHKESAWQWNRRAGFVTGTPPAPTVSSSPASTR